ncbi:melanotransferrin-like [Actinia tenebrosa]|uniref:Melanotransferrin-like n=1 Tax=Actinia tenebrosa TaxID=6105 RepID=A0A6P8IS45_ACTTE|nr:melanotransferrin-like [Actinia tenebrosa]
MRWFTVMILFVCTAVSANAEAKKFRWCCIKDEMNKCKEFKKAFPGIAQIAGVGQITPDCVSGDNKEDCMKKIKNNEADFVTLSGGDVLKAGKTYDLVPIVAEDYETLAGMGYYSVIVAKKDTTVTIGTLKGKKSCHTGYRRTAGWNIPIGYLLYNTTQGKANSGCDAQFASNYFSKSCVPGAPKLKGLENLCALCPKESNCESSADKNTYSGYHGAFQCMADKKGDVAFVKHVTTAEVLNYASAKYGKMSDYKYICPDGTTKVVTQEAYEDCSYGRRPSNAVVTRTTSDNKDFVNILVTASKYCQPNTTASNCSGFLIFESSKYVPEKSNLLFRDSTKKLVSVGNKNTYDKWLGAGYIHALAVQGGPACAVSEAAMLKPFSYLFVVCIILGKVFI